MNKIYLLYWCQPPVCCYFFRAHIMSKLELIIIKSETNNTRSIYLTVCLSVAIMDERRYVTDFRVIITQCSKQTHDSEDRLFSGTVVTMVSCHRTPGFFLRCTDASHSAMRSHARHWLGNQHTAGITVCLK